MKSQACLLVCMIAGPLLAQLGPTNPPTSVTLAWDASTDTNVAGCKVYYGAAPRFYTNLLSVIGTSVTISNLVRGANYYFAATRVAADGLESAFSNEMSYSPGSLPVPPVLRLAISPNGKVLEGTADPYAAYQVERAVDWSGEWTVVGTIQANADGAFAFSDPAPPASQAFYRLKPF